MIRIAVVFCIGFLMLASCTPVEIPQVAPQVEPDELIENVKALDREVASFGEIPRLIDDQVLGEHKEYVSKLRESGFLKKFRHACELARKTGTEKGTLPPQFFTKNASQVYASLHLLASVSIFEDRNTSETNDALQGCTEFLAIQKYASRDENWSTMLRYRARFLRVLNCNRRREVPPVLFDFLQNELDFESKEATWYWDAQINSVLDWQESDCTDEQVFLIALSMDAKERSNAEAWLLYDRFIEKSNVTMYTEIDPLVISDRLVRLYALVDNKELLKRCHAFWSLKENLVFYRIGLIIRRTIVVETSRGSDPHDLPGKIAAEIQESYPAAKVRFQADSENEAKNICQIWVRLGIQESLHQFRLPEVVFQRMPLEFEVQ